MKRLLLQIFLLMLTSPIAITLHSAEDYAPPSQPLLSLAEAIDTGLKNSPKTKQQWWLAMRAAGALGVAKSTYYPRIDLNANIKNGQAYQFTNGPSVSYTYIDGEMLLDMLLFDSGERQATVLAAKYALLAADWQTDWQIQSVMIDVLANAYALYYSEETLKAALTSLDDGKKALDVAIELNRAGISPITDVHTSRATFAQMEMEVSEKKAALDIQRGTLATAMGLSANAIINLQPLNFNWQQNSTPTNDKISTLITVADQNRSDLIASRAALLESIANRTRAERAYLPKVSFSSRGGYEHAMHDRAKSGDYQVRLDLSVPLFTGFKATYEKHIAYADVHISEESLAQLKLEIALQVLTYSRELKASQEMMPQSERNLKYAEEAYDGILIRYAAGTEKISELSIALRQVTQARLRHSDVIARYLNALANLAFATGTLQP